MQIQKLSLIALSAALLMACEQPATVPSYIQIDSIELDVKVDEGTDSHKITDAWVVVNGNPAGAYELPAQIPLLNEGDVDLVIKPGIKLNGISTTRLPYPFFTEREYSISLTQDSVIALNPRVEYTDNAIFTWLENFEDPGFTLEESNKSDTTFIHIDDPDHVFEGNKSVGFFLDTAHTFFEGISSETFNIPTNGERRIFLELNYKCDNAFTVGIFANDPQTVSQEQILRINPKEDWNKIYVNLGPNMLSHPNALGFRIFFGAVLEEQDSASVYLDNIKLVYR